MIFLIIIISLLLSPVSWASGWYSTLQGAASDVEQTPPPDGVGLIWVEADHQWEFSYAYAPAGGTTGQVLTKNSGSNYDYSWSNPSSGPWSLSGSNLYPTTLSDTVSIGTSSGIGMFDVVDNATSTQLLTTSRYATSLSPPIDNAGEHSTQATIVEINDDDYSTGTYGMPLSHLMVNDNYGQLAMYGAYDIQQVKADGTPSNFYISDFGGGLFVGNYQLFPVIPDFNTSYNTFATVLKSGFGMAFPLYALDINDLNSTGYDIGNSTTGDWNISNVGKLTIANILDNGLTASQLIASDSSKNLVSLSTSTYPSLTELSYVKGVTSAIQTQINALVTGVSSVSNSDGTLTISPTTGAVVASLALGHANTWTGQQTFNSTTTYIGNQSSLGSEIVTNGTFTGSATGWTLPTGWAYSSNTVVHSSNGTGDLVQSLNVYQGGQYLLSYVISGWTVGSVTPSLNNSGFTCPTVSANGTYTCLISQKISSSQIHFTPTNTSRFTLDNVSLKQVTTGDLSVAGGIYSGQHIIQGINNTGAPSGGGVDQLVIDGLTGEYDYLDFMFSGVLRESIQGTSNGILNLISSGGNIQFYDGSSLMAYIAPALIASYGYGGFSSGVNAGSQSAPPSTLTSSGSFGIKHIDVQSDTTLNSVSQVYTDCGGNTTCSGSITYACSHWGNQSDCQARESHGGCSWATPNNCSIFNSDPTDCSGTSGCSLDTTSCLGPTSNDGSCEAQNTTYGGSCSFVSCEGYGDPASCSGAGCTPDYSGDCTTILDQATCDSSSGCSDNEGDCGTLSDGGGDGTLCATQPSCSYDSPSGTCSGSFFVNCTGSYYTDCGGDYCSGSYNNGTCDGTYGGGCSGTSSCTGVSSGDCSSESGCSTTTGCTITMCTTGSNSSQIGFERNYSIKNIGSGTITVKANSGDHIIDASTTTYDLSGSGQCGNFSFNQRYTTCVGLDESDCGTHGSQCTQNYFNCGAYSDGGGDGTACGAADVGECSYDSGSGTCSGGNYTGCTGQYVSSNVWELTSTCKT